MLQCLDNCVLSSRIRLARNIKGLPFPSRMTEKQALDEVVIPCQKILKGKEMQFFLLKNIAALNKEMLIEKHLVSKDLVHNSNLGALILNDDQTISIMLNEEDHFREQCILKGFKLLQAWETLNEIDALFMENLEIAYDKRLGFLTACPTNLGTAMRASIMLFLPGLTLTSRISKVIDTVNKLGIVVRGAYGESSNAECYFYQVSNSSSFGINEENIINNINDTVEKICNLEQKARQDLYMRNPDKLKSEILQAENILENSYSINHNTFLKMFAKVKLGISLGIIKIRNQQEFDDLIEDCAPAQLQILNGRVMSIEECDIERAKLLNTFFKNL